MACGKHTMKWKRAMNLARKGYPRASLARRKKIAGAIIGGKRRKR